MRISRVGTIRQEDTEEHLAAHLMSGGNASFATAPSTTILLHGSETGGVSGVAAGMGAPTSAVLGPSESLPPVFEESFAELEAYIARRSSFSNSSAGHSPSGNSMGSGQSPDRIGPSSSSRHGPSMSTGGSGIGTSDVGPYSYGGQRDLSYDDACDIGSSDAYLSVTGPSGQVSSSSGIGLYSGEAGMDVAEVGITTAVPPSPVPTTISGFSAMLGDCCVMTSVST